LTYAIEILRSAQKQLSKIQRQEQQRIIESIGGLANDPRPSGCRKVLECVMEDTQDEKLGSEEDSNQGWRRMGNSGIRRSELRTMQ
jgi:mRNA-degrading endonuclease RelE of RelBE toxin-antitoxin system